MIEQKILFSKVSKLKTGEFLAAIKKLIKKEFRLVFYVKSESNNFRDWLSEESATDYSSSSQLSTSSRSLMGSCIENSNSSNSRFQ